MHPLTPWQGKTTSVLPRSFGKIASLLSFLMAAATAGCSLAQFDRSEGAFARQFPYEDVNHTLVLRPIEGVTDTRLTRAVAIQLVNRSDRTVAISPESGIVGLVYDTEAESWVEVENAVEYPDMGWLLGPRGGEVPSDAAVYFEPDLESPADAMDIRVLVVGHVWDEEQGAGEAVAAYLDLTLEK